MKRCKVISEISKETRQCAVIDCIIEESYDMGGMTVLQHLEELDDIGVRDCKQVLVEFVRRELLSGEPDSPAH